MKRKFQFIVVLTILLSTTLAYTSVSASTAVFTLEPLPTVRYEVASINSVDVTTAEELTDALNNQEIDLINMSNNIALPAGTFGFEINRDLRFNGNNHILTVTGSNALSPNRPGGTLAGAFFNLGTDGSNGVFHLQNFNIALTTTNGTNSLISTYYDAIGTWDVILDNFNQTNQHQSWGTMLDSPMFKYDATNLFIRNDVRVSGIRASAFTVSGKIVVENGAVLNLSGLGQSGISAVYGTTFDAYFGPNSRNIIHPPITILDSDNFNGGNGNISNVRNMDIYSGANVQLLSGPMPRMQTDTLTHDSEDYGLNIRIDNGGIFHIRSNRNGSAINATSPHPLTILGNPNATFTAINNSAYPTIQMGATNSVIDLVSPRNYNIQNDGSGIVIAGTYSDGPILILRDTQIGIWQEGYSVTGESTLPSPFDNATLIAGISGPLEGSSLVINDMPGGWSPTNTKRIAYAQAVNLVASDMHLLEGMSQTIESTVVPSETLLTFVSNDTDVVTVDEFGLVSANNVGSTTVTVTGTLSGFHSRSVDINVTVHDDELILEVPSFTEIDLNDDFDHMIGVSAIDSIDGILTEDIQVKGKVDSSVAGIYIIDYTIINSRNTTVTARQNVLVNDGDYNHKNGLVISGQATSIANETAKSITDEELIEKTNIKVYDLDANEYIDKPEISVNRNDFTHAQGEYIVTFTYNPSIDITITVLNGDDPDNIVPDEPDTNVPDSPDGELTDLPNTGQSFDSSTIFIITTIGALLLVVSKRTNMNV